MPLLNLNVRTENDERNDEARQHNNHECHFIGEKSIKKPNSPGYVVGNIICIDCGKQFKSYNWESDEQKDK